MKSTDTAQQWRERRLEELRARARLRPSLEAFDALVSLNEKMGKSDPARAAMSGITGIFRGTYKDVLAQIGLAGKVGIGATNAIKRSAGTNFQGLCEYAILNWLQTQSFPVAVGPNAPKSMKDELTIYGHDADGGEFSVEPDIDICLWTIGGGETAPVIFLSAKTSLVDRAGQAARWKLYLDMHQTACPHIPSVLDCPINRTRVKIRTKRAITHAIVTANIYKIDTTQPEGELPSGQCRNNTYMFKHKYTTRDDANESRPKSWRSFSEFPDLVAQVFKN